MRFRQRVNSATVATPHPAAPEEHTMADAKRYVEVNAFSVKEIWDPKFKAKAIDALSAAAEAAVKKSGKLTLDKPKDKSAKGWSVSGTLVSMGPDKSGKKFSGKVSIVIATWPGKSMKAMPSGEGGFAIDDPAKLGVADVVDVAKAIVTDAMKAGVKFMEDKAPE